MHIVYFIFLFLDWIPQNIDGLERKAGLNEDLLVEAHGSFSTAKCTNRACGKDANPQKVWVHQYIDWYTGVN